MSIVTPQIERVIYEDGPPYAECDGCHTQIPIQGNGFGWARHPAGWHILLKQPPDTDMGFAPDLSGFCSWACLAQFVHEKAMAE